MQSKAATVEQYLAELTPDRRDAIQAVREVILKNLGEGFEEGMSYGMIGYCVPHSIYPPGYHCNPKQALPYAGLASQKQYMSVYLMTSYGDGTDGEAWFRRAWAKTGKKLDMGKCCIRFKRVEDLALEVIGEAIRRVPVKAYIEHYERAILSMNKQAAARAAAKKAEAGTKKPAAKPAMKPVTKAAAKSPKKSAKKTAKKVAKR